jgi:hypothetical protein
VAFSLPTLPLGDFTHAQFQIWWQQVTDAIEGEVIALEATNAALEAQQAELESQQAELEAQQTALTATNATLQATILRMSVGLSWTTPSVTLAASDAGSNTTVTVNAHTRVYPDGTQLAVSGGSFTGKAYSTQYGVYYDDATLADTTPTYQITTDIKTAQANYAAGRHFVGVVTTPAAGGGSTGGGTSPPGGGGNYQVP